MFEKNQVHHTLQGKKRKRSEGFASEHKNEQVAEFLAQLPSKYSTKTPKHLSPFELLAYAPPEYRIVHYQWQTLFTEQALKSNAAILPQAHSYSTSTWAPVTLLDTIGMVQRRRPGQQRGTS